MPWTNQITEIDPEFAPIFELPSNICIGAYRAVQRSKHLPFIPLIEKLSKINYISGFIYNLCYDIGWAEKKDWLDAMHTMFSFFGSDLRLWIRISLKYPAACCNRILFQYRDTIRICNFALQQKKCIFACTNGNYIRWSLRDRCACKEQSLLFESFNDFD